MGNPGRILKYRFSDEIIARLLSSSWWDKSMGDLKEFDFTDIELFLKKCEFIS